MRGYVYFVSDTYDKEPIKIGFTSTASVLTRMVALQTGCPFRMKEIFSFETDVTVERKLQRALAIHRIHGDWFRRHPDVLEIIQGAKDGDLLKLEEPENDLVPYGAPTAEEALFKEDANV